MYGRDGRGTPVIFAAGNSGDIVPGYIAFPANLQLTVATGAIRPENDSLWYYSSYGPELDVVAPSGDICALGNVWSIDQMGTPGYNSALGSRCGMPISWSCGPSGNDNDYMCKFGGTSAAAPVVAGITALLLSRSDSVWAWWRSPWVASLLERSAVTDLDWGSLWVPSEQYGWGRVDAFRAILSIARGDVDNSGGQLLDAGDLSKLIDILFIHPGMPEYQAFPSPLLADCNCDGWVDGADLDLMIHHLFIDFRPMCIPCYEYEYYGP